MIMGNVAWRHYMPYVLCYKEHRMSVWFRRIFLVTTRLFLFRKPYHIRYGEYANVRIVLCGT